MCYLADVNKHEAPDTLEYLNPGYTVESLGTFMTLLMLKFNFRPTKSESLETGPQSWNFTYFQ
jgi:hypothetical protein